jgi:S1-C subfamily serine protease
MTLGITSLATWLIPLLGLIVPVVGLTLGLVSSGSRRVFRAIGIAASTVGLALALTAILLPALRGSGRSTTAADYTPPSPDPVKSSGPVGLTLSQAQLACATIEGAWTVRHPMFDDPSAWTGSAVILGHRPGRPPNTICLATNSHCLALADLATAVDRWFSQGVSTYTMVVTFPSGKRVQVRHMADTLNHGLDLALIEVDASGLTEGVDYVSVRIPSTGQVAPGETVLAVGSPKGLSYAGSVTQGIVSSVRPGMSSDGTSTWSWIQHTAAINHGNSGGPLFVQRAGSYWWIGVNTGYVANTQGMFFALQSDAISSSTTNYAWGSCDPTGAVEILAKEGHSATVAK